jgi:Spy/CpxP family protein refolding chaperone
MKKGYAKTVGIAAGAMMLAMTSSWASADGGWHLSRGGHGGVHGSHGKAGHNAADRLLRHKQLLGLTEDQTAKLKQLALERDVAAIKVHAAVMLAARELRALVSDDTSELSTIEAKVNEQEQLEGKLKMVGIKARRDAYAVLTPEQRNKLKALREQMRHGYRSHMMKTDARPADHEETLPIADAAGTESTNYGSSDQAG